MTHVITQADFQSGRTAPAVDEQSRETHFLLSRLDLALTLIERSRACADRERASQLLSEAVDSYGSVKNLFAKLGLSAEQATLISNRLKAVQQCLQWDEPPHLP